MSVYYAEEVLKMIILRNIKENKLNFQNKNKIKLDMTDIEYKEITNVDLMDLRSRLKRPGIIGELFLHRKNDLFQYSWNTSDHGINLFSSCGSRAVSEDSAYIFANIIPSKKNITLLNNNTDIIDKYNKNPDSIETGFYLFKEYVKNSVVYTAINNINGTCELEDFNSLRKAILYFDGEKNINSLSEQDILMKTKVYSDDDINNIDFELTKLNFQNNTIILTSDSDMSVCMDVINWLNLNKPEHVSDFTINEIDEIQKNLDNWTLKIINRDKLTLCDSNGNEKCSGLYNLSNWCFNLSKEQRLFYEKTKIVEKDQYTNALLSEIHWKKRLYEFENVSYLNNLINVYPENIAPYWLPKNNAKLLKKAINENIAPFLPDDFGRLRCYPIYNFSNKKCLPADILIPAQIKKIAQNVKSNYVLTYSYVLNNRINLIPGTEGVFFNYKSSDEKIKTSTLIFPENIRKKRIEKKLNKRAVFNYQNDLSQLSQEILSSEPVDYLAAYMLGCKTGMEIKVNKNIADVFVKKMNDIIDNELLPDFKKNKKIIDIASLFNNVEKKCNSIINSVTGNLQNQIIENKKVRGYQRAREEITR